jgi:hypothetical protein
MKIKICCQRGGRGGGGPKLSCEGLFPIAHFVPLACEIAIWPYSRYLEWFKTFIKPPLHTRLSPKLHSGYGKYYLSPSAATLPKEPMMVLFACCSHRQVNSKDMYGMFPDYQAQPMYALRSTAHSTTTNHRSSTSSNQKQRFVPPETQEQPQAFMVQFCEQNPDTRSNSEYSDSSRNFYVLGNGWRPSSLSQFP